MPVYALSEELAFPHPSYANDDGLLAIGGDLSPERLILAYENGIFPWYSDGSPIMWWSPDPRFVLYPQKLKVSKSMKQVLRGKRFSVSFDCDFRGVISACQSVKRADQDGTWITEEMLEAYVKLHELGLAHSVEVWKEDELVGGLYGISLGAAFFGESMFAHESNASKLGFITLVRWLQERQFHFVDCQTYTPHLESLGAEMIAGDRFQEELAAALRIGAVEGRWRLEES